MNKNSCDSRNDDLQKIHIDKSRQVEGHQGHQRRDPHSWHEKNVGQSGKKTEP